VKTGSPAEQAGLQRGDTIISYQGNPITDLRTLQRAVTHTPVDTTVSMMVIRDGKERQLHTTVSQLPDSQQLVQAKSNQESRALTGVKVKNLDQHLAQRLGVDDQTDGVVVTDVQSGSQMLERDLFEETSSAKLTRNRFIHLMITRRECLHFHAML